MSESNAPKTATHVAALSFEDALAELEVIIRQLEAGQAPLDATIGLYDRATALKHHCEARLKDAEMRIEQIIKAPDGSVSVRPLDDAG